MFSIFSFPSSCLGTPVFEAPLLGLEDGTQPILSPIDPIVFNNLLLRNIEQLNRVFHIELNALVKR